MKRPTIFISSTIYDFRDLRGALKDYLELRGCKVLASDHNDFNKDLEPHSYEACLQAIESADVFLLLIGSRVGGLVDANGRLSITHAEYKRAYELAGEGRIRLLSFVRTEVFNHRESVKDMQRFLKKAAEDERETVIDLLSAPTKFMTDANTITHFIEEVSRNAETSAASKGQGEFPKANWLHQFSTFPEIRTQLDILILAGLDVTEAAGKTALLELLKRLLRDILMKLSDKAIIPSNTVRRLVREIGLDAGQLGVKIEIPRKTWSQFAGLTVMLQRMSADADPLVSFLSSPLLLDYEPTSSRFQATPEHRALATLIQQIANFNLSKSRTNFFKLIEGVSLDKTQPALASTSEVAGHLMLLIRWSEMAETAYALARALIGHAFEEPQSMPKSPFIDQENALVQEELSIEQVERFLSN